MIGPVTGTRVVITAAAVTLLLGLAACSSDDPEPRVAPPTSQAPSTSPASDPTPSGGPSLPPQASALSPEGAESFIDYWFRALSYGMATGDTSMVGDASETGCKSCSALIGQIEDLYAKGGKVETAGWRVEAKTLVGGFDVREPSFLLRVNEAKRVLLDGEKVVDRTPMAKVPMHIQLSSESGTWTVSALEIIE